MTPLTLVGGGRTVGWGEVWVQLVCCYGDSKVLNVVWCTNFGPISRRTGLVPEQTRQVEEEEEDHQRLPLTGNAAADTRPAAVLRRGRHGEQLVLLPRQRLPLGDRDAGRVSAAAPAVAGSPARHAAVLVTVQPGTRTPQLNGPFQRPVLQRPRAAVAPLPDALPRHVGLYFGPQQRVGLPAAVQRTGQ